MEEVFNYPAVNTVNMVPMQDAHQETSVANVEYVTQCRDLCIASNFCLFFTLDQKRKICSLKYPKITVEMGAISGSKECYTKKEKMEKQLQML